MFPYVLGSVPSKGDTEHLENHESSKIRTWPRDRIANAVRYARKVGGIGSEPLPGDVGEWTNEQRELIEAFDWYVQTKPKEASELLEIDDRCVLNSRTLNAICWR